MMRTAKTRKPACDSAATTAAVSSRRLGKAGAPMSARDDRGSRSAGYAVGRVGCSSTVGIHNDPGNHFDRPLDREELRAAYARARDWAVAQGYTLDEAFAGGSYIKCEKE
jgi:hypothetical protein